MPDPSSMVLLLLLFGSSGICCNDALAVCPGYCSRASSSWLGFHLNTSLKPVLLYPSTPAGPSSPPIGETPLTPLFLSYFYLMQHKIDTLACRYDPILVFQAQGSYTLHQSCPLHTPHALCKEEHRSSTLCCQTNDTFGVAHR